MITRIFEAMEEEEFDIIPFCPMEKKSLTRKGIVEIIEIPILANYMFWYYDREVLSDSYLREYMPFRLLYLAGKARYVDQSEIEHLSRISRGKGIRYDRLRNDAKFLRNFIGRRIIVRDKILSGLMGTVKGVKKAGVLYVDLMVFRRSVTCEISVEQIEFL